MSLNFLLVHEYLSINNELAGKYQITQKKDDYFGLRNLSRILFSLIALCYAGMFWSLSI